MNPITKSLRDALARSAWLLAVALSASLSLLAPSLRAQNPEWMLFNPKTAGVPTACMLGVTVDRNGRVWTACNDLQTLTGHGLAVFDGRKWTAYNTRNSRLPSNSAFAFAFDKAGNAWIGTINFWGPTGGSGLVKFDGTNWTVFTTQNSKLPSNNIWDGAIDPQGRLWLATGAGVVRFDGNTWTAFDGSQIGLPSNWFSALAVDSRGNVWVATYERGGGVARFDGQAWAAFPEDAPGMTGDAILNVNFDLAGNTWFSAIDRSVAAGSLVKFDGTNWTTYSTADSACPGGWALAVDQQGTIWAGGGGILAFFSDTSGGVAKFNGQDWTIYDSSNSGMPARKVWGLASDNYGNIWMGTESGLVAYRPGGVILPQVLNLNRQGNLRIPSEIGKTYNLQVTSEMSDAPTWSSAGESVAGTGNPVSWSIDMAAPKSFYRVQVDQ